MTVEKIKQEQSYARMWSEKTHHPDDATKIGFLLKEVERLKEAIRGAIPGTDDFSLARARLEAALKEIK